MYRALIVFVFMVVPQVAIADVAGDPEKLPGWIVAYETDITGAVERGSLARLVRAVEAGADIKMGTDSLTQFRTCDSVSLFDVAGTTHVGCSINNQVALALGTNPITARPVPYRTFWWWDTNGGRILARASIYGGADLGQDVATGSYGITWFARVR